MSNDNLFDEELRRMAQGSMKVRASAVDTDTALNEHRSRLKSPPTSARHGRRWLAAAAAVFVVAAGMVAITWRDADAPDLVATETVARSPSSTGTVVVTTEQSTAVAGVALADALVNGDWVAIDSGDPTMPWLRFFDGGSAATVAVAGWDGCNDLEGSFRLDGNQIVESEILSTLVGCGGPGVAGLFDGTMLTVEEGALVVVDATSTRTHYLAVDTFDPLTPDELVGTYTLSTTPITITPDTVTIEGCERTWSADDGSVVFEPLDCSPPLPLAMTVDEWDSLRSDPQRVLFRAGDRWVRLDRTTPEDPARPGLASFLGAIGNRTWVYDAPLEEYPFAHRPSLTFADDWVSDGDVLATGFDGCNTYSIRGNWTPTDAGWGLAVTEGESTTKGCDPDLPTVMLTDGDELSLAEDGVLTVARPDVVEPAEFRDIRAATRADMLRGPIGDMPGEWDLDPDIAVEITPLADGAGEILIADCTIPWQGIGNEWIDAGPLSPECITTASNGSVDALFGLIETVDERGITIGFNPDRTALYLAHGDGTTVLRLTRTN